MSLQAVQTAFYDTFGALYEGQLAEYGSVALCEAVRSYRTEEVILLGRGVMQGTVNGQNDSILTPYGVKNVDATTTVDNFVGISVLNQASSSDASNNPVTVRDTTMIAVAELGSGVQIGALVPAGVTVAHKDPVYLSISDATIGVGRFAKAAAAGRILVPGAYWYGAGAAGTVSRILLGPVPQPAA